MSRIFDLWTGREDLNCSCQQPYIISHSRVRLFAGTRNNVTFWTWPMWHGHCQINRRVKTSQTKIRRRKKMKKNTFLYTRLDSNHLEPNRKTTQGKWTFHQVKKIVCSPSNRVYNTLLRSVRLWTPDRNSTHLSGTGRNWPYANNSRTVCFARETGKTTLHGQLNPIASYSKETE